MSHHIATLHMNLPHEKWSKTAPIESSIENKLTNEEMARRKAVDARKEAERLRQESEAAKVAAREAERQRLVNESLRSAAEEAEQLRPERRLRS